MKEALHVSALLLYEFRQSLRFQVFLHSKDRRKGFGRVEADGAVARLQANIAAGALVIVSADWAEVYAIAERLSGQYTYTLGHRAFDILHLATALHLGARPNLDTDIKEDA